MASLQLGQSVYLFYVQVCILTAELLCTGDNKSDAAAEDNVDVSASELSASHNCDIATSHHSKFVWPGIDAVVEAYASHVEGDDSC